jgi:sugar lactone lactonase YvrE
MMRGRPSIRALAFVFAVGVTRARDVRADDAATRCQRGIENGAHDYASAVLRGLQTCVASPVARLADCADAVLSGGPLRRLRATWGGSATAACAGVDVAHELGYLDRCIAPPPSPSTEVQSRCDFPTPALDTHGQGDDVLDCLACQIGERLRNAAVALLANRPSHDACQTTIGVQGLGLLGTLEEEVHSCLQPPDARSIATCLSDPARRARVDAAIAAWRTSATTSCTGIDPFAQSGYPALCSGIEPPVPPDCGNLIPPCTLPPMNSGGAPGNLLDCLQCQVQEATLGVSRDVFGADVCCIGDGCASVRTRAACHAAGGRPIHYRVDPLDNDLRLDDSHGIAMGADGTLYYNDIGGLQARDPSGAVRVLDSSVGPFGGVAVAPDGTVYAALRNAHRVERVAPDGTIAPFAGTGIAGHSGDGGPALTARIVAPNGIAADAHGNVYVTESGLLGALTGPVVPLAERVRSIDAAGTIHTVAGDGTIGTGGIGGPAVDAELAIPYALALLHDGSLLISEAGNQRILRLSPLGTLEHVAGRPTFITGTFAGDGGPALDANLFGPEGLGEDKDGKIFVTDFRNNRIRLVDRDGSIITVAGTGLPESSYVGAGALVGVGCPLALAVGSDGRVFYVDGTSERFKVVSPVPY